MFGLALASHMFTGMCQGNGCQNTACNCASSRSLDLEINLHRHVRILSPASYPIFPSTLQGAILLLFFYFLNSKIIFMPYILNFCIEDSVKKIIQTSENYAFL
jgi:hypothetical protein